MLTVKSIFKMILFDVIFSINQECHLYIYRLHVFYLSYVMLTFCFVYDAIGNTDSLNKIMINNKTMINKNKSNGKDNEYTAEISVKMFMTIFL